MSKLYVVGTPIGNLDDISLRALQTLNKINYIACEDTRKTKHLFKLLNIDFKNKKFIAHHNFNEHNSARGIIALLEKQFDVVLVSDAGMPTISDPGYKLINETIKHNFPLEIIPGPTAIVVANLLANFSNQFTFLGFLRDKVQQRINQLKKLIPGNYVFFVSPHKLQQTLLDIETVLGKEINVFLGKELTKMFEKHYRGTITEVINQIQDDGVKGEYTIVINLK